MGPETYIPPVTVAFVPTPASADVETVGLRVVFRPDEETACPSIPPCLPAAPPGHATLGLTKVVALETAVLVAGGVLEWAVALQVVAPTGATRPVAVVPGPETVDVGRPVVALLGAAPIPLVGDPDGRPASGPLARVDDRLAHDGLVRRVHGAKVGTARPPVGLPFRRAAWALDAPLGRSGHQVVTLDANGPVGRVGVAPTTRP